MGPHAWLLFLLPLISSISNTNEFLSLDPTPTVPTGPCSGQTTCTAEGKTWIRVYECDTSKNIWNLIPDQATVQSLAGQASVLRIYAPDNRYVQSKPGSYILSNLKAGKSLSYPPSGYASQAVVAATWDGPQDLLARMWNSCGNDRTIAKDLYWSCNNQQGLHLIKSEVCDWNWSGRVTKEISIWIDARTTPRITFSIDPADASLYGDPINVYAELLSLGSPAVTPTGKVTLTVDGKVYGSAVTLTNQNNIFAQGVWTINDMTILTVGTHSVSWHYEGDSVYAPIDSGIKNQTVKARITGPCSGQNTCKVNNRTWLRVYECDHSINKWELQPDQASVQSLAGQASLLRIYAEDNRYVQSKLGSYVLKNLQAGKDLAYGPSGYSTAAVVSATWDGPQDLLNRMWNSCGSDAGIKTDLYWSCNNQQGLHLIKDQACDWIWNNRKKLELSIWIDQVTIPRITFSIDPPTQSLLNQNVNIYAELLSLGDPAVTPTGKVTLTIDGKVYSSIDLVNKNNIFAQGVWTLNTLSRGVHTLSWYYEGDNNYASINSGNQTYTVTVVQKDGPQYNQWLALYNNYILNSVNKFYLDVIPQAANCTAGNVVQTAPGTPRSPSSLWRLIGTTTPAPISGCVKYGDIVNLQNAWNSQYLDACGGSGCSGVYGVSTHWSNNRDHGTGFWLLTGAGTTGDCIGWGDVLNVQNQYGGKSYLDVCGRGLNNSGTWGIQTASTNKRDGNSGNWVFEMEIAAAGGAVAGPQYGDSIGLYNTYSYAGVSKWYLDVARWKSGCGVNGVNTAKTTWRDPMGSGLWKISEPNKNGCLRYGDTFGLQSSWTSHYLDICGGNSCGSGGSGFAVQTSTSANRDSGTGRWTVLGGLLGTCVGYGDATYLINGYAPKTTFLEVCGVNEGTLAVQTYITPTRDANSGIWFWEKAGVPSQTSVLGPQYGQWVSLYNDLKTDQGNKFYLDASSTVAPCSAGTLVATSPQTRRGTSYWQINGTSPSGTCVKYGDIINLQSTFNYYLDACGGSTVCSSPNGYNVQSSPRSNRDSGSGRWTVCGGPGGQCVGWGEGTYLRNEYGGKSYLDVCKGGGNAGLAIQTYINQYRDNNTADWIWEAGVTPRFTFSIDPQDQSLFHQRIDVYAELLSLGDPAVTPTGKVTLTIDGKVYSSTDLVNKNNIFAQGVWTISDGLGVGLHVLSWHYEGDSYYTPIDSDIKNYTVKVTPPKVPIDACMGYYSVTTQYPEDDCYVKNAKLNSTGAWCPGAATYSQDSYLQIDLGATKTVTSVTTQGRQNYPQWVTTYLLQSSTDGYTWSPVGGDSLGRVWNANKNQNDYVTNDVGSIVARYVRIIPYTWYGWPSIRVCVGTDTPVALPSLPVFASSNAVCKGEYSATTEWPDPTGCDVETAQVNLSSGAWCALVPGTRTDFMQIDFGSTQTFKSIFTQGRSTGGQWVTSYYVKVSLDGSDFTQIGGLFKGNDDYNTMVGNWLEGIQGRYVRVYPFGYYGHTSMRVCVETEVAPSPIVVPKFAQGVAVCQGEYSATTEFPDFTGCDVETAQVNKSSGAWCALTAGNLDDFMQIDLGLLSDVIAIFTQGRSTGGQWVTSYYVQGSLDGSTLTQIGGLFGGNNDANTIVGHTVQSHVRYVRIYPVGFSGHTSMRVCVQTALPTSIVQPQFSTSDCVCKGLYSATTESPDLTGCDVETAQVNLSSGAWCPVTPGNKNDFMQIDLGTPQNLVAIFTQGRSTGGQWATSYYVQGSLDGNQVTQIGGLFGGNNDANTIVGHSLQGYARYVRVYPQGYYGWSSIRVCVQTVIPPPPIVAPQFSADSTTCQGDYSATSTHPTCHLPPLVNQPQGWCALTPGVLTDFVQIDLGSKQKIADFFFQGRSDAGQWVTSFYLYISDDGFTMHQVGGLYGGSNNQNTIIGYGLETGVYGRYIRIYPVGWYGHTSLRACVKTATPPPAIQHPQFLKSPRTCPGIYSASSIHPSCNLDLAQINSPDPYSAWCALTPGNLNDFLQIDLTSPQDLANFYVQGRNGFGQYVTSFYLYISEDGENLQQVGGLFGTPGDANTVLGYKLNGVNARFIRVYPVGYNGHTSLRACVETVNPVPAVTVPPFIAGSDTCQGIYSATSLYAGAQCAVATSQINTSLGGWCAQSNDVAEEFLQIDLGTSLNLSAIYLQGRYGSNQRITGFYLNITDDGFTLTRLGGLWHGNYQASNTLVTYSLVGTKARYIRIIPQGYNEWTSFRSCVKTAIPVPPIPALPDPIKGFDKYICPGIYSTPSQLPTTDCDATIAQLGAAGAYCPLTATKGDNIYLQIDLPASQGLASFSTQGRGNAAQWTNSFFVKVSDGQSDYTSVGGLFSGNTDQNTIVTNSLAGVVAKSVRIYPVAFYGYPSFRACLTPVTDPKS